VATVYDLVDLAELTRFARTVVPLPDTFGLDQFLPNDYIDDIRVDTGLFTQTNRSAVFRAYDAETPIGQRDTFSTKSVKIPPLGQKLPVGEYERIQLERARGSQNGGQLASAVYDDTANNTRAINIRAEFARGDVLTDGKFTLANENGLTIEADFGVPAGNLSATAGTDWATVATADPVADITSWMTTYQANASDGSRPARMLISRKVLGYLQRNAAIRTLAGVVTGAPNIVTEATLNATFNAYGLPQISVYEAKAKDPVSGATVNILGDDKVFLLPANGRDLGRTVWGITAEALELVNSGFLTLQSAPGITAVTTKEFDPVRVWTKTAATMMPVLDDPTKLFVVDVTAS
jgi:hypothetical protein